MFTIENHIAHLLIHHDCVVLPNWGALVAHYQPANYDAQQGVMHAPCRVITFNPAIKHDDGTIATSVARVEGISFERAKQLVADKITAMRRQLGQAGEVSLGTIGYWQQRNGTQPEFRSYDSGVADRYYGLTDFRLASLADLNRSEETTPSAQQPSRRRNVVWRAAASIAVLVGMTFVLTTPLKHSDAQDYATFTPTIKTAQASATAQKAQYSFFSHVFGNGKQKTIEGNYPALGKLGNQEGKYYMIIASLASPQEVEAFKQAHQDLTPYIKTFAHRGRHFIYVARSNDYQALLSAATSLPKGLQDVWISD